MQNQNKLFIFLWRPPAGRTINTI